MSTEDRHIGKQLNAFFIRDTDTGAVLVFHRAASRR